MDCDTVSVLLPEFALGVLSGDEEAQVRSHLAECDAHAEAVELRAAAIGLAGTVEDRDAPAGARDRLMDALGIEAPSDAAAPRPLPTPLRTRSWLERAGWQAGPLAAALALIVVGLVIWNVVLQIEGDEVSSGQFQTEISGAVGTVLHLADEKQAVLDFRGLPTLGTDQEYQVWLVGDGDPQSAGTFRVSSTGEAAFVVPTPDGIGVIAVTVEPAGGSPLPTSDPILVAEL